MIIVKSGKFDKLDSMCLFHYTGLLLSRYNNYFKEI